MISQRINKLLSTQIKQKKFPPAELYSPKNSAPDNHTETKPISTLPKIPPVPQVEIHYQTVTALPKVAPTQPIPHPPVTPAQVKKSFWQIFDINLLQERVSLLTWVIIPFLVLWISVNYIIGNFKQTAWRTPGADDSQVLAKQTSEVRVQSPVTPFYWSGSGVVSFWFDDAWETQYTSAFPVLDAKGYKASLAVPTRLVDDPAYMSWPQVKRLYYKGWEIDPHSRTHNCSVQNLKPVQIDVEVLGSKQDLETEGLKSDSFIYITPCGTDTPQVKEVIKKNYVALRSSNNGLNPLPLKDPYNILVYALDNKTQLSDVEGWLQEADKKHSWLILMFHQVDDQNSQWSVSPARFAEIVQAVEKSKLPVQLPKQVMQLVPANFK
jgi:peptidoglycan/xylan/chitin deacetylase (PgdA/CDA1 family)